MQIIIDTTDLKFALVLNPTHQCAEGDAAVNRTYSVLTLEQLRRLYKNTTGYTLRATDYNASIQVCKFLAIRLLTIEGSYAYDLEKDKEEAITGEADR